MGLKLTAKQADKLIEEIGSKPKGADMSASRTTIAPASANTFFAQYWPIIRTFIILWKGVGGLFKGKAWKTGIDIAIATGDAVYNGIDIPTAE